MTSYLTTDTTFTQIANTQNIDRRTVKKWFERFQSEGNVLNHMAHKPFTALSIQDLENIWDLFNMSNGEIHVKDFIPILHLSASPQTVSKYHDTKHRTR